MKNNKIQNPGLVEAEKNELTEEELDEVSGGMLMDYFDKKKETKFNPADLSTNPAEALRKFQKDLNKQ